jgi:parvulin-like peptidyl-prolyl isomerase
LIEAGQPFDEIAREHSVDPFSAPKGGDLGLVELGTDPEYDEFFATMEVGDVRYFRSLEGHLIMWLRDRREGGIPTFEEARESITRSMLPAYKDQMLVDWITEVRERRGVTTNQSVLEQIDSGS